MHESVQRTIDELHAKIAGMQQDMDLATALEIVQQGPEGGSALGWKTVQRNGWAHCVMRSVNEAARDKTRRSFLPDGSHPSFADARAEVIAREEYYTVKRAQRQRALDMLRAAIDRITAENINSRD